MAYEQQIVNKADSWVGTHMSWIPFNPANSTLNGRLTGGTLVLPINPDVNWTVNCFEMPLMAAIDSNGITQWYVKKVLRDPNYYLKGHYLEVFSPNNMPRLGDLVFWKSQVSADSLLARVFGAEQSQAQIDWGLDHVALATGNGDEVISFWESNVIEKTSIGAINQFLSQAANGMGFIVSFSRGPWYWKWLIW